MFSWPMITALLVGGVLYSLTSVPQIPATSIFIKAASSGISGMGYSRISVLLGATLTAARTFSTTQAISTNDHNARGRHSRRGPRSVKGDLHGIRQDGAACMSAMLGISGFRAQADVQKWSPAPSDECCALSR